MIEKDQLNKNLENIDGLMLGETKFGGDNIIESLPATVTLNGYYIEINSNGEVRKIPEIIAKMIANPKAYYGKKVTNYKASDGDTNTYRIFYIDKENYFGDGTNTIYLKADFSSTNYNLNSYASYDSANTKVREMNPLWAAERGTSESSWNINEKASAYLCSPVNANNYASTTALPWNGYYKANDTNVNYVIGGPSVEMYVKSYNQAYKDEANTYTLGATYRSAPGYIYTLDGRQSTISNNDYYTGTNSLDYTKYNSMYCGKNGRKGSYLWWLASPSVSSSAGVCFVGGDYASLGTTLYDWNRGVSPLVSLKSSFIPQVEE